MSSASVGFHCPECVRTTGQKVLRPSDLGRRPAVLTALIVVNVLAFVAQLATGTGSAVTGEVYRQGVLFGPFVGEGEVWRIVTAGFLHGSLIHIGFNMYALYLFGQAIERPLGAIRMLLVYTGGLLGGAAAVLAFNFDTPTLGASGAVLGLAGGLAAILMSQGRSMMQTSLGPLLLINLGLPLLVPGISFWGHLGGVAGGFAVGAVLGYVPRRFGRTKNETLVAAGAVVVALGVAALWAGLATTGFSTGI